MSTDTLQKAENLLSRVTEDNVVFFQKGIPGFPRDQRYVIIQNPGIRPFAWLQSLDTPELAFAITSPFGFFPDYRPDVSELDLGSIGSPPIEHVLLLSIVKIVNSKPIELHMNLKAPLIINATSLAACQVILTNESIYSEKAVYRLKPEEMAG
jgi:flagellar assembly factor FliW